MTLTRSDRQNLLGKITTLVAEKYYDPAFGGKDWEQIVSKHTDSIVQAETVDGFEAAVTSMLHEVHSSGMGLLGPTTKITPRSAINASFRKVETTADGTRWVFQDVLPGGVAARAGVQPGDALISANGTRHRVCCSRRHFRWANAFPLSSPETETEQRSVWTWRRRSRNTKTIPIQSQTA